MHVQKIEKLPDYPALRQVQNALWKIGEVHGAAVMVGAGFSQFADRAAETPPLAPLWPDHIRNLTELLSRFGMLFQGTAALDLFRFGTSLAHDPNVNHWFHFESLQNLLRRSLQALEPERRGEAALDVLLLPLLCEKEVLGREFDWTEVFNTLGQDAWRSREQTDEWSLRIASL